LKDRKDGEIHCDLTREGCCCSIQPRLRARAQARRVSVGQWLSAGGEERPEPRVVADKCGHQAPSCVVNLASGGMLCFNTVDMEYA
jgi:hypothetical protein